MILGFNNDAAQAQRVRAQVMAHTAADEIIQGRYWENGKGCFIGCLVHGRSADEAAELIGGDLMFIKIAESIFEGLANDLAKGFPARIVNAIMTGADLSLVPWQFLHWLVVDALVLADDKTRKACEPAVAVLLAKSRGEKVARDAAANAADAADAASVASYAADASYAANAADAAFAANAAYAAACAVTNATDSAYAAANASYATNAASYADNAARINQADKLIELIEAAGEPRI